MGKYNGCPYCGNEEKGESVYLCKSGSCRKKMEERVIFCQACGTKKGFLNIIYLCPECGTDYVKYLGYINSNQ